MEIDYGIVQQVALRVQADDLAAGADAGIDGQSWSANKMYRAVRAALIGNVFSKTQVFAWVFIFCEKSFFDKIRFIWHFDKEHMMKK